MITVPSQIRDFPEWHGGCRHALVWALEVDTVAVRALVEQGRERLAGIVAPRYGRQPHVTLAYAGLEPLEGATPGGHLYRDDDLAADLAALRAASAGPLELTISGWGSFSMAPYLAVDCPTLPQLAAGLAGASPDYVPHVTLGLYSVAVPIADVAGRLADWPASGLRLTVGAASLLSYETADIAGPLTTVGRLDLTDGTWTPSPRHLP